MSHIAESLKRAALQQVRMAHRAAETAALNRVEMIRIAQSFGASWAELGEAMGLTKQSANKRFGPGAG